MSASESRAVATATDVARLAGVSQSAVSRAFTPGASIAPQTRHRIQEAARQLGYQPNLIARSLTSGRSNIVGVGIGNLENPFFASTLEQMSVKLGEAGLRLLLFTSEVSVIDTPVQEVLQYRLDALVLLSTSLSSTLAQQCQQANVPVVLYNRIAAESPDVSSVTGNNVIGGRAIASFLLAGGHQRPAFIAGLEASSTSRQREEGFVSALMEQGMGPPIRDNGLFTPEGAAAATRRLLSARERPDAIFCANDYMALVALDVAQAEFGLEVGREISIVGFDDIAMAGWPSFSLTTYSQSTAQMVDETIVIVQGFRNGDFAPVHRVVEGQLVIRNSTRRPSRAWAMPQPPR